MLSKGCQYFGIHLEILDAHFGKLDASFWEISQHILMQHMNLGMLFDVKLDVILVKMAHHQLGALASQHVQKPENGQK